MTAVDALVLGSGPAGAVAALRLARAGASVAVATRGVSRAHEGLSGRALALLAEERLDAAVAACGQPVERGGVWGDRPVEGHEWLVRRAEFDRALLCCLRQAGVRIVTVDDRPRARLVVDARGRRAPQGRRGPALLAIAHAFRRAPRAPAGTRVDAWSRGWVWSASAGTELTVQLVGAARDRVAGGPREWLRAAAAELPALRAQLERAQPAGAAFARPAHARLGASDDATAPRWPVGDAAVALDPLSGQGVYEALRGARAVAAAALTVLEGGDPRTARAFVGDRAVALWSRTVATAARHYAENAHVGEFWSHTAAGYAALAPPRAADAATGVRVERRPVLANDRVVVERVIVTPAQPRGVWHLDGVPLAPLLEACTAQCAPPAPADLAARLDRPLPAVVRALGWLAAAGALRDVPLASAPLAPAASHSPAPLRATGG